MSSVSITRHSARDWARGDAMSEHDRLVIDLAEKLHLIVVGIALDVAVSALVTCAANLPTTPQECAATAELLLGAPEAVFPTEGKA